MFSIFLVPIFAKYVQRYYIFFIYASARKTFLKKDLQANRRQPIRKIATSLDSIEEK